MSVIALLSDRILELPSDRYRRVGIDGIDTAGKTTMADHLAADLRRRGMSVVRVSIDGFHRPREERLRRGSYSPEGYYLDSFDYPGLRKSVFEPLESESPARIRTRLYDFRTEQPADIHDVPVPEGSVVLMDGVFLFRPELVDVWDYKVFIHITFEECLRRARSRDLELFGDETELVRRYEKRYIPGQRLYLEACRPDETANIVVDNTDWEQPVVTACR